jgi:predicted Zn finger-like uncharacterized protein
MDIICESCQSRFNIPDEKIPDDRVASLTCPKCKNRIKIQKKKPDQPPQGDIGGFSFIEDDDMPEHQVQSSAGHKKTDPEEFLREDDSLPDFSQSDSSSDTSMDKPFDFIEEEGRTALLCEVSSEITSQIKNVLDYMEYHVTEALSTRDALKQMRYHDYDLIIVNENFDTANPDTNGVLMYLSRMPINIRRNVFVAMISRRFKTLDYMMAFVKSVNLIINERNIPEFETVLQRGIADTDILYKTLKDSLKRAGLI